MRQLSITIILGALFFQSCDGNRSAKVSKTTQVNYPQEEIQREEISPAAVAEKPAAVVATPAPVVTEEPINVTRNQPDEQPYAPMEEPAMVYEPEEVIYIQAEEAWPKNRGKTYNELQLSDDVDDYPFKPSTEGNTFNERQISD